MAEEEPPDSGDPLDIREPSPAAPPQPEVPETPEPLPEPAAPPGPADVEREQRAQRIQARRRRVQARRREELGIVEEEEEKEKEEEEEQRRSLKLIEDTEKALAKLLFHGTQLVTDVRVDTDLREGQRRDQEAKEKRSRLERLEREAKACTEKFGEISSRWALTKDIKIPQELQELLRGQQEQCELLLRGKNRLLGDLRQELQLKDEQYEQALAEQGEQIQLLLLRMEEQTRNMLRNYRHNLRLIEETFEQERRELLDSNRKKWNDTIQEHNDKELEFLRDQTEKAEEFEKHLNELQDHDLESYDKMKLRLEKDVQYLEQKLEQMKGVYHLNLVKLDYNLELLRQQDVENSTLRSLQKRRINRLQSSLSAMRSKLATQEQKFQEEKQSLESDRRRITGQHKEMERRMRHFAISGTEKFRRVWLVNEEEAKGLMRKALEADRIIHVQQLGMAWEEPLHWFLENVGPLGEKPRKREAIQVAEEVLKEQSSGQPKEGEREKKGLGKAGQEAPGEAEEESKSLGSISKKTIRRILELLRDESGFLTENKLLKPLQELGGPRDTLLGLGSILEALRIEDEDDLFQLVDFFLKHKSREATESQDLGMAGGEDAPGDPAEDAGGGSQKEELQSCRSSQSSIPSVFIHVDDVLKILKEFLKDYAKLREDYSEDESLYVRDTSRDAEYWEALTHIIPEPTLKLWDALDEALLEYHRVLSRRARLLSEATVLQQQNAELGVLLGEYLGSQHSR